MTRRTFAGLAGTAALARAATPLTAQQVIDRIQANAKPDSIKAGDPATAVKGIATTAMATMDVLTRAARENLNLIVTLEGNEFTPANNLVVWKLTDQWRARKPDPFATGLASALGWSQDQVAGDPSRYDLPALTLAALVDHLKKRLNAHAGLRAIGDPQTRVRRITLLPGISPLAAAMKSLPESDVILAGETREWESVEYVQDTIASGQKKGMIMLGRVLSEDPGMNLCAAWIKTLVPEVPVKWIPVGDPYWRPS